MKALEIKENIYWVGGIDWDLRDFHGYITPKGSTYNAYLVIDEKIVLVDTVKHYLFEEMLSRIKTVVDPSRIDYIVCNHVEMDHSGGLARILKLCKNAQVVSSPNGEKGLKKHYDTMGWNFKVVSTGSSINIGKRNLEFMLMPMVHWPDSMATYIKEANLLLPNDAFGQHIASAQRFDDELGWENAREEAAKYYANIVLPYGEQVKKALSAMANFKIDMIAPSHGIIWRKHVNEIINKYKGWADNVTKEKAVIIYDTMWESTTKIARAIYEVFEAKGKLATLMDLRKNDASNVMTELLEAKHVCVGSPTLNNGMMPLVSAFLTYMKGLRPKNRVGLSFGSYGWGGQSINEVGEVLSQCGFEMLEPIKIQYVPTEAELEDIKEKLGPRLEGTHLSTTF